MKHFREPDIHPRFLWRTFTDIVTIKMDGPEGFGADCDFEVEFSAYPGDAEPRELNRVSVIRYGAGTNRPTIAERQELPSLLLPYVRDCIDLNALETDWG